MPALATVTDPVTVANRLRPVLLKLNRHLRREIHSLGVTGGQASLLFTIQRRPGIGVREPSDEDRRRVGLRVSPEGERVLRSVKSRRTAWLAAGLRRLSEAELEAVDAAIEPLQELIDE